MKAEFEKKLNEMEQRAMCLIDEGKLDDAAFVMMSVEQARHALLKIEKQLKNPETSLSHGEPS